MRAFHMAQHEDLRSPEGIALLQRYDVIVANCGMNPLELRSKVGAAKRFLAAVNATSINMRPGTPYHVALRDRVLAPFGLYDEGQKPIMDGNEAMFALNREAADALFRVWLEHVFSQAWDGIYIDQFFLNAPDWLARLYVKSTWSWSDEALKEHCGFLVARVRAFLRQHGLDHVLVLANSAGKTWPGLDGITKEKSHIERDGRAVSLAQFNYQAHEFGGAWNVAWDVELQAAELVMPGDVRQQ